MPVNAHGGEYIQFYVNGVSTTTSGCFSYSSDGNVGVGSTSRSPSLSPPPSPSPEGISFPSMSIDPGMYTLSYHFTLPGLDRRHFILGNISNKKEVTHMRRLLLEGK